jgi:hypothetical protein
LEMFCTNTIGVPVVGGIGNSRHQFGSGYEGKTGVCAVPLALATAAVKPNKTHVPLPWFPGGNLYRETLQ